MDKGILQELIIEKLSLKEIAEKLKSNPANIYYWLKKFGLKTSPDLKRLHKERSLEKDYKFFTKPQRKYNFIEIQKDVDLGLSWRELTNKYKVSSNTLNGYFKKGKLIGSRSRSDGLKMRYQRFGAKKATQETKDKISKARIKYLQENPDKVPYLINHSSKKSYPEQIFEEALLKNNINGWIYAYRNGIYEYDFAFPDLKIDVEIDGGTHNSEKVIKIDKRRDMWSESEGWKVLRFKATDVKKDVSQCIERLKQFMQT